MRSLRMKAPVEGTENQTVSSAALMKRPGAISSRSEGQHRQAPRSQATNMSKTERSKVMSKVCEQRSSSVIP